MGEDKRSWGQRGIRRVMRTQWSGICKDLALPSDGLIFQWHCSHPATQAADFSKTLMAPFSLAHCQSLARPCSWVFLSLFCPFLLVSFDLTPLASHLSSHSSLLTIRPAVSSLSIATPPLLLPFCAVVHCGATLSCSLVYSCIHSFVHPSASFEYLLTLKLIWIESNGGSRLENNYNTNSEMFVFTLACFKMDLEFNRYIIRWVMWSSSVRTKQSSSLSAYHLSPPA